MSLRIAADPYARALGQYTAYELRNEHVGTLDSRVWTIITLRDHLERHGYESSPSVASIPLEAAKKHPETGRGHDLALRRVATADDYRDVNAIADRTERARHEMLPVAEQLQYHVHAWLRPGGIELHSHFEWRPDLRRVYDEDASMMYHRLRAHYRPGSYGGGAYLRRAHDTHVSQLVDGEKE